MNSGKLFFNINLSPLLMLYLNTISPMAGMFEKLMQARGF